MVWIFFYVPFVLNPLLLATEKNTTVVIHFVEASFLENVELSLYCKQEEIKIKLHPLSL